MRKYTKIVALSLIFSGCQQPKVEQPDFVKRPEPKPVVPTVNYVEIATDQQYQIFKNSLANTNVVEYYSAVWCGYCKEQTPIIKELSGKHKNWTFAKIDVDGCTETSRANGIVSLPTTVVKGKKFVGLTQSNTLEKELK